VIELHSPYLDRLKNRMNFNQIPFSDRGSRLMVFRKKESPGRAPWPRHIHLEQQDEAGWR